MADEATSWFTGEDAGAGAQAAPGGAAPAAVAEAAPVLNGTPEPAGAQHEANMAGKPAWLRDGDWTPLAEGATADWQAIAKRLAEREPTHQSKITEQAAALAKHTVPDSVTPYFEGIDKAAMLAGAPRSGFDEAQLDQVMAQLRSAGVGPGPAQGFVQTWLKSRHEATPEAKTGDQLRDAAINELNAGGRPGSEMAKKVRAWGGGLVREEKLSVGQAHALEALTHTPAGIEALHALMSMGVTPGPSEGSSQTRGNAGVLEQLEKEMADPRFGADADYTAKLEAKMRQHESLIASKWPAMAAGA